MARYAALLRGVNVGPNKRVPMAEWRALLEAQGCTEVQTLLNSGNAVFASRVRSRAMLAKAIRAAIVEQLNVDVPVIVKSAVEIAAVVAGNPFGAIVTNPSHLFVAVAPDAATLAGLGPVGELVRAPERWHLGAHAAYLWCPGAVLESAAGDALLGTLGRGATTRNWATTVKIAALVG